MADPKLEALKAALADFLGLTELSDRVDAGFKHLSGKLDTIRTKENVLMTEASALTAAVDAVVSEDGEVKQILTDLVAQVAASGNPELVAAAADATSRLNVVVTDLHTAATDAGVTTTPAPTPIPAPGV